MVQGCLVCGFIGLIDVWGWNFVVVGWTVHLEAGEHRSFFQPVGEHVLEVSLPCLLEAWGAFLAWQTLPGVQRHSVGLDFPAWWFCFGVWTFGSSA